MPEREIDLQGAPGTGKTRIMIRLAQTAAVQFGPHSVAACTFTRAAAGEFRARIALALGLEPDRAVKAVPYVGTVHSLAWRLLGRPPVVADGGRQFARDLNISVERWSDPQSGYEPSPDEMDALPSGEPSPDWGAVRLALAVWDGLRHRYPYGRPLDHLGELLPLNLPAGESYDSIHDLIEKYEGWKHERHLLDFADLLIEGRLHTLPVRVLILDEAQDNSPLLWSVVDAWAKSVHTLFCGGDPFQAIYLFAGARPELLRDRKGDWVRLKDAHRFSAEDAEYAKSILRRAGWSSDADEVFHRAWAGVGDSPEDGTTFYLARTHALLTPFREQLIDAGEPFGELRGKGPLQTKEAKAWLIAQRWQQQEYLSASDLLQFADALPPRTLKWGTMPKIKKLLEVPGLALSPQEVREHLGQMTPTYLADRLEHAEYYRRVWNAHGDGAFKTEPRTRLGTIHAAKGREADSVHLVRSWGRLPAANARRHPEEEGLVAYVAASRHRKELVFEDGVGQPYDFP